jgi:hypothetical protein
LDLAYKYIVTCCPWTSEGLRRRDRPTLMLPAPDNAVAAGGDVESRGHVSEGVMGIVSRYRSCCEWALLTLSPHKAADGRPFAISCACV